MTFEEFANNEENVEELDQEEFDFDKEFPCEDSEDLANILVSLIHDNNFNFFKILKCMESKDLKIYQAPSNECKMVLLNTIITYIDSYISIEESKLIELSKNIIDIYNSINIVYLEKCNYNLSNILNKKICENKHMSDIREKLLFIQDDLINKFRNKEALTTKEINLVKIQIFTFASIFINFDDLMNIVVADFNL